jgi:hypothetical protein
MSFFQECHYLGTPKLQGEQHLLVRNGTLPKNNKCYSPIPTTKWLNRLLCLWLVAWVRASSIVASCSQSRNHLIIPHKMKCRFAQVWCRIVIFILFKLWNSSLVVLYHMPFLFSFILMSLKRYYQACNNRCQASTVMLMRSVRLGDITLCCDSGPLKMGPIHHPEMSVNSCRTTLHNIPEERRSHVITAFYHHFLVNVMTVLGVSSSLSHDEILPLLIIR